MKVRQIPTKASNVAKKPTKLEYIKIVAKTG